MLANARRVPAASSDHHAIVLRWCARREWIAAVFPGERGREAYTGILARDSGIKGLMRRHSVGKMMAKSLTLVVGLVCATSCFGAGLNQAAAGGGSPLPLASGNRWLHRAVGRGGSAPWIRLRAVGGGADVVGGRELCPGFSRLRGGSDDGELDLAALNETGLEAAYSEAADCDALERMYQTVLSNNASHVPTIHNYGNLLMKVRGNYTGAESMYKRALTLDPSHVPSLCNYGNLLHNHMERSDEAEEMYKKALEVDGAHATTMCNYGLLLQNVRKDYVGAEDKYKKALEADATHSTTLYNYARLKQDVSGDYQASAAQLGPNPKPLCAAARNTELWIVFAQTRRGLWCNIWAAQCQHADWISASFAFIRGPRSCSSARSKRTPSSHMFCAATVCCASTSTMILMGQKVSSAAPSPSTRRTSPRFTTTGAFSREPGKTFRGRRRCTSGSLPWSLSTCRHLATMAACSTLSLPNPISPLSPGPLAASSLSRARLPADSTSSVLCGRCRETMMQPKQCTFGP